MKNNHYAAVEKKAKIREKEWRRFVVLTFTVKFERQVIFSI